MDQSTNDMSETISPNTTIAQYTIVSKLGEGGMGEVWRALAPMTARHISSLSYLADPVRGTQENYGCDKG